MSEITQTQKDYVASLIGQYKNNGAVSCVGINFHLIFLSISYPQSLPYTGLGCATDTSSIFPYA